MPPAVLAGVAIVGAGVSIYGQIQAANAQADAAKRDAANKKAMSDETLYRASLNKQALGTQIEEQVGNQTSQYAAGNVDVGSGSPLVTAENTLAMGRRKMFMMQEEANFQSQQDLIGAGNELDLSEQMAQAGKTQAFGTALTTAGSVGKNYSSTPGTSGLNKGGYDTATLPGARSYMYNYNGVS